MNPPFANRTALPAVGPDLRALLRLAGPILVVQLAQMGIATTDVVIAGRARHRGRREVGVKSA